MKQTSHIIVPEGLNRVLLHACCAPCSSAIVEWLLMHEIEPVIYYFNPNIYPQEEYEIRKQESQRHAESLGIRWIDGLADEGISGLGESTNPLNTNPLTDYDKSHQAWRHDICGLENEPERGKRCEACFYHRLLATAHKAQELGIGWFATTLASSRWKNLDQVNAAGLRAAETVSQRSGLTGEAGLTAERSHSKAVYFWAQNWRKDGLQDRRNALLKEYNFYNQQYCGCEFSFRSTIKDN